MARCGTEPTLLPLPTDDSPERARLWMKKNPDIAYARRIKSRLNHQSTPAEKRFESILYGLEVSYKKNKMIVVSPNRVKFVDFYLKKYKLIIEIDGGYHKNVRQDDADWVRDQWIKSVRPTWTILRFWNEEVLERPWFVVREMKKQLIARGWNKENTEEA